MQDDAKYDTRQSVDENNSPQIKYYFVRACRVSNLTTNWILSTTQSGDGGEHVWLEESKCGLVQYESRSQKRARNMSCVGAEL